MEKLVLMSHFLCLLAQSSSFKTARCTGQTHQIPKWEVHSSHVRCFWCTGVWVLASTDRNILRTHGQATKIAMSKMTLLTSVNRIRQLDSAQHAVWSGTDSGNPCMEHLLWCVLSSLVSKENAS